MIINRISKAYFLLNLYPSKKLSKMNIKVFLGGIALLFLSFANHKYYVSTTHIDYIKSSQSLQITLRIFTDDFENLLQTRYSEAYQLHPDNYPEKINKAIQRYISSKLKLSTNGSALPMQYIGKKYQDDQVICYFEVEQVPPSFTQLEISNSILFDLFEDQQNVIHFSQDSKKKSFLQIQGNAKSIIFI